MGGCLSSPSKPGSAPTHSAGNGLGQQQASGTTSAKPPNPSVPAAAAPAAVAPEANGGHAESGASERGSAAASPQPQQSAANAAGAPLNTAASNGMSVGTSASQVLAAGGTLLSPPTVGRDGEYGTARATSTPPLGPITSSEAGSLANPDGSAAGTVQATGFQCMPAEQLAKEVAQLSWVGHGGYGAVYKGVWQGASVAVKFTVADYMDFAGASAHEAVLSKMLSHPNVVQTFASRVALLEEEFLRSVFDGETNFPSRELPVDSFRSGEGFGSPYGINTSMRFRDVLTHIGARPGHYITQLIMEYCDRGSLHQAIAKGLFRSSSKWNNKIALRALLRTAREIAQGMSHLHACRVVHGDLKPGNVLLMSSRADRRGFTAKVSDFGLSTYCMASHTSVTRWSTVSYMAPEAFEGHLTMGSDTYSFGVLLWEMYTGQQPYAGMQAAQIVMGVQAGQLGLSWPPDSDPRIVELVESCIQRNAAARPTFMQLIKQLTQLEAHIRLEAPTSEASEQRMSLLGAGSGSPPVPGATGGGGNGPTLSHAGAPGTNGRLPMSPETGGGDGRSRAPSFDLPPPTPALPPGVAAPGALAAAPAGVLGEEAHGGGAVMTPAQAEAGLSPPPMPFEEAQAGLRPPQMTPAQAEAGLTPPQMPLAEAEAGLTPPQMPLAEAEAGLTPPQMPLAEAEAGLAPPPMALAALAEAIAQGEAAAAAGGGKGAGPEDVKVYV